MHVRSTSRLASVILLLLVFVSRSARRVACAGCRNRQPIGSFEVFRVAVALSPPSTAATATVGDNGSAPGHRDLAHTPLLASLRAALIRVKFPPAYCNFTYRYISEQFTMNTSLPISDTAGLTRLVCSGGGGSSGSSSASSIDSSSHGRPYRIFESIPISHQETILRRILPLRLGSTDDNGKEENKNDSGKKSELDAQSEIDRLLLHSAKTLLEDGSIENTCLEDYVAVFPLETVQQVVNRNDADEKVHVSRRQTLFESSLENCVIRFLLPGEQIRKHPIVLSGTTSTANELDQNIPSQFFGDVPLTMGTEDGHPKTVAPHQKRTTTAAASAVTDYTAYRKRLIARANSLWDNTGRTGKQQRENTTFTINQSSCVRMPSKHLGFSSWSNSPSITALTETVAELFVKGEEDMAHAMSSLARVGMLTPDLGGVIMGPMKDIAKDFSQMAAGTMSEQAAGVSEETSAGQVDQALTEQITQLLSRGLKSHLTEALAMPLKETVVASVSGSTTQIFQSSLTRVLTRDLRRPLMEKVTDQCTRQLPAKIGATLPLHMARLLTRDLNHLLTRSLPHALVPALVHTLTHSPIQDYYCYYCFHHKAFCQYCSYAPQQLYYAMYYAGYYSTYYGDYFGDHVLRQLSNEALQLRRAKEEAAEVNV